MLYLLLSIAAMSAIMVCLKIFAVKGINTPQSIVVNYLMATVIGIVSCDMPFSPVHVVQSGWVWLAALVGGTFFFSMNLYALSTKRVGVALTTISSRTALIIPIIFSCALLGESLPAHQIVGIALVVAALIVIFFNRSEIITKGPMLVLMPMSVFLITGVMNSSMKYAQHTLSADAEYGMFEPTLFCCALIIAIVYYISANGVKFLKPDLKSIGGGICLGGFNFLATYGVLQGLKHISTGAFYSTYYVGVVIVTALTGAMVFKEQLSRRKVIGIAMAAAAIVILYL